VESRRERSSATLTLLTRAYCHLCDEMVAALRPLAAAHAASIRVVDVDADPSLELAFGEAVPVLFVGEPGSGEELCRYRLDVARVAAALAARTEADRGRAGG
jgi:hypothetical protein